MDIEILRKLFREHFSKEPHMVHALPPAGSNRKYFRVEGNDGLTAIGAFNADTTENRTFISFTRHFRSKGLPVPMIYAVSEDYAYYLMEDLGDTTLKDEIEDHKEDERFEDHMMELYRKALSCLIRFQVEGHQGLDYSVSFPRDSFDYRSIMWDLNHLKYFFLKLSHIPYSENLLEDDFQKLARELDSIERNFFLFRDFQSRNIMLKNGELYFIDYQGGRRGALHYDLASLLFEARAKLSPEIRNKLFNYYFNELLSQNIVNDSEINFRRDFMSFALVRQLQAMGAYGLRGWIEGKPLFIQSIAYAVVNLEWIIKDSNESLQRYPELLRVLTEITKSEKLRDIKIYDTGELVVRVYSFSYYRGIPDDYSGNGGGYVFDCRHILNPGKFDEFRHLTGLDNETKIFFQKTGMNDFLKNVIAIIDMTVETYKERGFRNLQVSFGCTGGQHRSVYAAEKLAEHLEKAGIKVILEHLELKELNR